MLTHRRKVEIHLLYFRLIFYILKYPLPSTFQRSSGIIVAYNKGSAHFFVQSPIFIRCKAPLGQSRISGRQLPSG